jgi:cytochrome c oxidase assembly factor CtaG
MTIPAVLTDWQAQPTVLLGIGITVVLYGAGIVYSRRHGLARHLRWWQPVTFALGLLLVIVALMSPLDALADSYLWAHMVQHEILTMAVPPLLLLSAPAWPLWRGVPRSTRLASLRWVMRRGWPRRVWHQLTGWMTNPVAAFLLFEVVFSAWHLPVLYDLALEYEPVHVLEHMLFLGTALAFWAQVIPSRPWRPRLSYPMRLIYVIGASLWANVIGSVFMFSNGPMYPFYAALPRTPGMMTVVMDQHFAAAAMDIPGVLIFFAACMSLIGLWLQADEREAEAVRAPVLAGTTRSRRAE